MVIKCNDRILSFEFGLKTFINFGSYGHSQVNMKTVLQLQMHAILLYNVD